MKLAEYLKREKLSHAAFAEISGVTASRIGAICLGEGTNALTAYQIMRAAPEVTLIDLVGDSKREILGRMGLLDA
tara:strand:- start:178 stop:402 length:225 start_codon:yes stop_codon:yes gene_type:complete